MNELQIKLTADIASFKAAMATVESKLEKAEQQFTTASNKVTKYSAALDKLASEYKQGSISQEDFAKKTERITGFLVKQQAEVERTAQKVNTLANSYQKVNSSSLIANQNKLSQSTNNLGNSVNGLTNNVANGNGVALEFNRIIQDAPFGIIGVGNNIQQLAGNFSQLSKSAGGTGAALKATFASLATGPNLALLAISALTAGFTAYQMSSRKTTQEVDKLKEAQDSLNDSFKQTEQLAKAQFYAEILSEIGLLETKFTDFGKILVDSGLSSEEALQRIATKIKTATKPELEALESFLRLKFQDATRLATNATTELEKQLGRADATKYGQQLNVVTKELEFYSNASTKAKSTTDSLLDSFTDTQWQEAIDNQVELFRAFNQLKPVETEVSLSDSIANDLAKIGPPVQEFAQQYQSVVTQVQDYNQQILGAFTDLGVGIVGSLDISNNSLRGFLTTLVSATPKIIGAMFAQARASQAAAKIANVANKEQAIGAGIVTGANAAKGLGPIGLALLPVFIAGAVALVSGAFKGSGGGGGGGGGSASAGIGSTFTNAKPPNVGGFASPARTGVDTSNVSSGFGSMQLDVNIRGFASGYDLAFLVEQANIKKGNS